MFSLRNRTLALAMIASFAGIGGARSADLAVPPLAPVVDYSGWYLRGDIGFSNQHVGSLFNENYSRFDSVTNIDKGFDAAPFFGLGIGYNVNNWLRFDVTGEYRARANFHGLDLGNLPLGTSPDRYTGSKYEWTGLLNGYVDLGTWWNFTPFLGAGVGFSRNTITNFGDVGVNACPGSLCVSDSHSSDASKWNFAWAFYAGFGYRVTPAVTIELAYRYIDLGNATTGTMVNYAGGTDTPFEFRHLTSSDLKLGVRYNFGAYDVPPPPPPLRSRG